MAKARSDQGHSPASASLLGHPGSEIDGRNRNSARARDSSVGQFLPERCFPSWELAFYFSASSYSTVGYGDLFLPSHWRLLGTLEAITGVLMCGISVSVLFALSPGCSIATHHPYERVRLNKAMPNVNIKTPDWLRQMESILEELNEGVAILDDQLRIVFANEALTRLWQYDLDELRGCAPDALFPPEDIPYIIREHKLGHRYGRHRSEFYLPLKNGTRIPVIVSGRVIQGPDGQDYVVVTVTDISELKRVEEQLRIMRQRGN